MIIANTPLNLQAIALEEAETKIRETVKNEFFAQRSKAAIDKAVFNIIADALKKITIPELWAAAQKSLINFYLGQYNELKRSFMPQFDLYSSVMLLNGKTPAGADIKPSAKQKENAVQILEKYGYDGSRQLGSPLQKFSKDYFREHIKPAFDRLVKMNPLDPDDITGRNTLRNKAEMEVRYDRHIKEIENIKAQGHKLVICSTHADCSPRCARYQGRVYSLDGTSGTADDGRQYVPLEEATDVFVTTKSGKTYKNGLFGFNCRHFLVPYKKGYRFPKPNPEEERRQYAITLEQRRLETEVRNWRTRAVYLRNTNPAEFSKARAKAIEANKAYMAFSKANNRAYYPSRTEIL